LGACGFALDACGFALGACGFALDACGFALDACGFALDVRSGTLMLMQLKQLMGKKQILVLAAVLSSMALIVGGWFLLKSRVITVWVYTDYAFRYDHPNWPETVDSRFQEVNRIYQRDGTGVRWKVLDSSEIDPTSNLPGIDVRRANMGLHLEKQTDIYLILTGVHEANRTGSASPFTRIAVVVDYPDKSESLNARLMAHELAHLFGAPHDPAWFESLMGEKPESNNFSERTVALIRRMRGYPFVKGIDGLSEGSWEKRALTAASLDDTAAQGNPLAHAHTVIGTALIEERRMEPALAHFRAAVDADPQNKVMHLNLAEAYTRDSNYEKALEQAREAVRLAPDDALAHRALGALLGRNHQPEAALQELQTAIRLEPNNPQNQVLLGLEYAGMFGHLDDAVATLQQAARVNPDSPIAKTGLEKAQLLRDRVQEALVRETARVREHPDDPDARYRLGKAEARVGDLKDAIRDFQKAAELRPDDAATHTELAELYLTEGDTNAAWAEIRKARALGGEPPQSLIARLPPQK
jgi:Flp pilus assembly protein TadD